MRPDPTTPVTSSLTVGEVAGSRLTQAHLASLDLTDPGVIDQVRVLCALRGGPCWAVDIVEYDEHGVASPCSSGDYFSGLTSESASAAGPHFDQWLRSRLTSVGFGPVDRGEWGRLAHEAGLPVIPPGPPLDALAYVAPGAVLQPPVVARTGEGEWTVWTAKPGDLVWQRCADIRAVDPDLPYVQRSLT